MKSSALKPLAVSGELFTPFSISIYIEKHSWKFLSATGRLLGWCGRP